MRSSGSAARVTRKMLRTLTAKMRSHSSTLRPSMSWGGTSVVVPALLMSASSLPNAAPTATSMARMPASSATSHWQSSAVAPSFSASAATARAAASLRL
jgi:hypothetical protein